MRKFQVVLWVILNFIKTWMYDRVGDIISFYMLMAFLMRVAEFDMNYF